MTQPEKTFTCYECEALYRAFIACAEDDDMDFYKWIAQMPKSSLTVFMVDKLHEMGFSIVPKKESGK